jgi:peptidoglycan hydrolase-like protein with peptidoglycan-binding domain
VTNPQPGGIIKPSSTNLEDAVRDLQQQVNALGQKTLRAAGSFYTATSSGIRTFETGPDYTLPVMPDGTPQWGTTIRDASTGQKRFQLWDFDPLVGSFIQITNMWDHLGNTVFSTDINGGIAEPWQPVPLYPKFALPAGTFQYSSLAVNAVETDMWAGKIGKLYYPRIGLSGVFGAASGTNTTRYRLKVAGVTLGTWDVAGLTNMAVGAFATSGAAALLSIGLDVVITAQTLSGTGSFAIQLIDCQLRQS